jgi:hypothetical protein
MPEAEQTTTGATSGQSPMGAQTDGTAAQLEDSFAQRPEIYVGAALLGGIVLAQVLKRLGADD